MILKNPSKPATTNLRLEDYATFQYMLAKPSIAASICNEIESFVFYNEPHDPQKKEHIVMVQGNINVANYYGCCLALLPSHLLGMSEWISSEDFVGGGKDDNSKTQDKSGSPKILRRFRYSYYFGLLQVDTRHMELEDASSSSSFRLVEYMDISPWAWVIAEAVFIAIFAATIWSFQKLVILFSGDTSTLEYSDPSFQWEPLPLFLWPLTRLPCHFEAITNHETLF